MFHGSTSTPYSSGSYRAVDVQHSIQKDVSMIVRNINDEVTVDTIEYLMTVYKLLGCLVLSAMAGFSIFNLFHLHNNLIVTVMSLVASLIILYVIHSDRDKSYNTKRTFLLYAYGLCQGVMISPVIQLAIKLDDSIVYTSLASTVFIFGCFTLSALFSRRRYYLYLGGFLSSSMSLLMLLGLVNMLAHTSILSIAYLYLGLVVFALYVCYDTSMIIERVSNGNKDIVVDALLLFVNFIHIFIRILTILMRKDHRHGNSANTGTAASAALKQHRMHDGFQFDL